LTEIPDWERPRIYLVALSPLLWHFALSAAGTAAEQARLYDDARKFALRRRALARSGNVAPR
jgi:hypothetical protein